MNENQDTDGAATFEDASELDPREAALLVEQTTREARRQFDTASPLAAVGGAAVFFFGYGAVWWSMHDQSTYTTGPAGWSIAVLYGLIVISGIVAGTVMRRATSGVSGRARRQMQAQGAAFWAAGIGAWTFQGALRYLGVSFEIIYGIYGPVVPLIALAGAAAGVAATRENWLQLGVCIAIIAVASVSAFFGPRGAWGLTGLGCALVLLGYAVALVRQRRPVTATP